MSAGDSRDRSPDTGKRLGAHEDDVENINYLNVGLMVAAMLVASYLPFETFVLAYALLGPLHYLTEISWLHDRRYFSRSASGFLGIAIGGVGLLVGLSTFSSYRYGAELSVVLMSVMLIAAAGAVFSNSRAMRLGFVLGGIVFGCLAANIEPLAILLVVFLPTLIHVYVFTGFFILYGALKSPSFSAYLSLIVYLLAPILCLYVFRTPSTYTTSSVFIEALKPFDEVASHVLGLIRLGESQEGVLAVMRLMAFAYTYHYLNWFSKTRIINWHHATRARLSWIVGGYTVSVMIYAIDFQLGFTVLLFLSLLHVVLEFPLNYRATVGVMSELSRSACSLWTRDQRGD